MDETENTTAPTLDTGTEVDHEAAARVASMLERTGRDDAHAVTIEHKPEPRARIMYRPAPVPAGYIAVEPEAPFWFLVKLDPTHEPCKGGGKVQGPDDNGGTQELYCACILSAVDECFREVQGNGEQHSAELRAERADKQLGERLERARAKVREIEQECTAAVGDCEKEQAELESIIPQHEAAVVELDLLAQSDKRDVAAASRVLSERELKAALARDEAVRRANAEFATVQREVARERQDIAATLQGKLDIIETNKTSHARDRAAAEARLAYLKAGPEKIRRRFEDKLKGPRATLERLERQWQR